MTDLAGVVAALAAQMAADPLIGVDSAEDLHLAAVDADAEWVVSPLPGAAICADETLRVAIDPKRERVTALFEIRLTADGRDGRGNHALIWALVESLRQFLVTNRLLAGGNPLVALLESSAPKGESYDVQQFGELGWLQTAVVRWQASWIGARTFVQGVPVDKRFIRTISLTRGVGGTEQQPPA